MKCASVGELSGSSHECFHRIVSIVLSPFEPIGTAVTIIRRRNELQPVSLVSILAQENYFGIDQEFKECSSFASPRTPTKVGVSSEAGTAAQGDSDDLLSLASLRPLQANIFITLTDIKAELSKVGRALLVPYRNAGLVGSVFT